jgi:hypothetical protein
MTTQTPTSPAHSIDDADKTRTATVVKAATYVVIPRESNTPSKVVARDIAATIGNDGPIHLCREIRIGGDPSDVLAAAYVEGDNATGVTESWTAPIEWLASELDGDVASRMANRLVVRVPWPPRPEAEMTLLLARLSSPGVRPAVHVPVAAVDEVFHYFNRLALGWIALPHPTEADRWSEALSRLCRLWCFDPRTTTAMEPIVSAYRLALSQRLHPGQVGWECRVVDAATRQIVRVLPWSPSVHAALIATPAAATSVALERLQVTEERWALELSELLQRFDVNRLGEIARAPSVAAPSEADHDA